MFSKVGRLPAKKEGLCFAWAFLLAHINAFGGLRAKSIVNENILRK